jgi:hypothetical protein
MLQLNGDVWVKTFAENAPDEAPVATRRRDLLLGDSRRLHGSMHTRKGVQRQRRLRKRVARTAPWHCRLLLRAHQQQQQHHHHHQQQQQQREDHTHAFVAGVRCTGAAF